MKSILLILALAGISSVFAEEWVVPLRGKPSNKPVSNTIKASLKLDFLGYKTKFDGEEHVGIRVRNGKHKQGASSITVNLGNAEMIVQRVDIMKPISVLTKLGTGEHLVDSFLSGGKPYEIYCVVKSRKVENLIVRSKK